MTDNETVTISSEYFFKLLQMAMKSEMSLETINALAKELDELKAKLDDAKAHYCTSATGKLGDACNVAALCMQSEAKRAAAERCIDDTYAALTKWNSDGDDAAVRSMFDNALAIIFAYREKEAAR